MDIEYDCCLKTKHSLQSISIIWGNVDFCEKYQSKEMEVFFGNNIVVCWTIISSSNYAIEKKQKVRVQFAIQ